jgi:hypothetical protein
MLSKTIKLQSIPTFGFFFAAQSRVKIDEFLIWDGVVAGWAGWLGWLGWLAGWAGWLGWLAVFGVGET